MRGLWLPSVHARNVKRYLPICTSSPSSSSADSTRLRLTKVPFRLPWSSIVAAAVALDQLGVLAGDGDVVEEDARSRASARSSSGRPAARSSRRPGRRRSARRAPALRPTPTSPSCSSSSSRSSARERLRRLAALLGVEERAALRAVVGGLRVLEAALRAVDVAHQEGGVAFPARISVSDGRRRPGRGRSGRRSSGGARRARPGGCRSSRAAGAAGTRPPAPPSCTRRSGLSGPRRTTRQDQGAVPRGLPFARRVKWNFSLCRPRV